MVWQYATVCGLCVIVGMVYRKAIIRALHWVILSCGTYAGWLIVQDVDPRLKEPSYIGGVVIGGVLAFIVVGVLCAGWIRQALILFYLQRTIQRDKDAAKAGRLW